MHPHAKQVIENLLYFDVEKGHPAGVLVREQHILV
jgi:hypothetical protein